MEKIKCPDRNNKSLEYKEPFMSPDMIILRVTVCSDTIIFSGDSTVLLDVLWALFVFESHRYLVKFLAKLTEYQDANKMTPGNMAIVLGPNLLWTHTEPYVYLHSWKYLTWLVLHCFSWVSA